MQEFAYKCRIYDEIYDFGMEVDEIQSILKVFRSITRTKRIEYQ